MISASQLNDSKLVEAMDTEECVNYNDKHIDELLIYSNEIIDKHFRSTKAYEDLVTAITEEFAISFTPQQDKFVFTARIPKNFDYRDVYRIANQYKANVYPQERCNTNTLAYYVFERSVGALAESYIAALNILNRFAEKNLSMRDLFGTDEKLSKCKIVYDPEKPYDAELILTINWLIELTANHNGNNFFYNYEINIKAEDGYFVYNVVFDKGPRLKTVDAPQYDIKPELDEYYKALSSLNFKELSESETANKFLEYANKHKKTYFAKWISANKDYFNNIFSVIRKQRRIHNSITYYAHKNFLATHDPIDKTPIFELTPKEEKLYEFLSANPAVCATLSTFIVLDFLYSPDEPNATITYKDIVKREIIVVSFAAKYAYLCFLAKKFEKICLVLQSYENITNKNDKEFDHFCDTANGTSTFLPTLSDIRLRDLNQTSSDTLVCLTDEVDKIINSASKQEEDLIKYIENHHSVITQEIQSIKNNHLQIKLEQTFKVCVQHLNDIDYLNIEIIVNITKDIEGLRYFNDKLNVKNLQIQSQVSMASQDALQTEINELQDIVKSHRYYQYKHIEDLQRSLVCAWETINTFLQVLQSY